MELDHLVVSASTLKDGVAFVEAALGVQMSPGGAHDFMGTHNALLSLGPSAYLEVIATDPSAAAPAHARWFNLDAFRGPPRLTNWICRSDDIAADRCRAPGALGPANQARRGDLNWQITIPTDGKLPCDGLCPGLIQWQGGTHPAQNLPDLGVRLEMLELCHPKAAGLDDFLQRLSEKDKLSITAGAEISFLARFQTPHGPRHL